jgi:DNA-binding beta-propeller fold protein YncE
MAGLRKVVTRSGVLAIGAVVGIAVATVPVTMLAQSKPTFAALASLASAIGLGAQTADGREQVAAAPGGRGRGGSAPPGDACGTPAPLVAGERDQQPVFPAGQYPISLPAVSPTGVRNDLPNPYRDGVDFGRLPEGRQWGSSGSITTAPDGTIWVFDRCGISSVSGSSCDGPRADVNPIFQFDTSGKLLKNFGAGLFYGPHKLTIDSEGNLWVADSGNQVFKLNQDGKVLLTLGRRGEPGSGTDQFDSPTEVAVASNGDFFVADGHNGGGTAQGNARILKFDKTGRFLKTWGRKGMGPGEFDVPHTIALDSRGRLFVGDRQNSRIQIFDADGRFIDQWLQFGRPSGIYIDKRTDTMYVSDSESRDGRTNTGRNFLQGTGYGFNLGVRRGIRIGSARDGKVTSFIPDPCPYPYAGISNMGEGVTADHDGNVYDAELSRRIRKFARR